MQTITATDVNVKKLSDELALNNIYPRAINSNGNDISDAKIILIDGTDMDLVQQIIDAHDATPIQTVSSDEILKAKIETETINLLIDLGVI